MLTTGQAAGAGMTVAGFGRSVNSFSLPKSLSSFWVSTLSPLSSLWSLRSLPSLSSLWSLLSFWSLSGLSLLSLPSLLSLLSLPSFLVSLPSFASDFWGGSRAIRAGSSGSDPIRCVLGLAPSCCGVPDTRRALRASAGVSGARFAPLRLTP